MIVAVRQRNPQMKLSSISVVFLVATIGCSQPPGAVKAGRPPGKKKDVVTSESVPLPTRIKSSISDNDRPDTLNNFIAKFYELHQKDPLAPFVELSWWGKMSDDNRTMFLGAIRQEFWSASEGKMSKIQAVKDIQPEPVDLSGPDKADNYWSAFPLKLFNENKFKSLFPKPTHVLSVEAYSSSSTGMYVSYLIGEHEGKFYFCTIQ